jgi:hypothetical protein
MTTLLALTAGIGLFLIGIGLAGNALLRPAKPHGGLEDLLSEADARPSRTKISLGVILESLLYQARAPLSPGEFLFTSMGLGALLGIGMFLASGAFLVSVVAFLAGGFLYYLYLSGRRDRLNRQYEEAQTQVVYSLYFYLKSNGLDFQGMVQHLAEAGPEIARDDWRQVAAAVSTARINVAALNRLITERNSPSFTRILEALLLFRGDNIAQLPEILEDLRRDISLEVEIAREGATHLYGARRQLLLVALMPVVLGVAFLLLIPSFKVFYQGVFGQALLLLSWAFSAGVYLYGSRSAARAAAVRPYRVSFPEDRPASVYLPIKGWPEECMESSTGPQEGN